MSEGKSYLEIGMGEDRRSAYEYSNTELPFRRGDTYHTYDLLMTIGADAVLGDRGIIDVNADPHHFMPDTDRRLDDPANVFVYSPHQGKNLQTPFETGSMDEVVIANLLSDPAAMDSDFFNYDWKKRTIAEAFRVLRPEGKLLLKASRTPWHEDKFLEEFLREKSSEVYSKMLLPGDPDFDKFKPMYPGFKMRITQLCRYADERATS